MAKKKKEDEDVDLGNMPELTADEMEGIIFEDSPVEQKINEFNDTDMSRIVEDEDDVHFVGTVRAEDMPKCPCCKAVWSVSEGQMAIPGCGCMIHPVCAKCGQCEAHCGGRHGK